MLLVGASPGVIDAALARGIPVTVLARRKADYPTGVRVVTGDVKFPESLAAALAGESVVVSLLRDGVVGRLSLQALIRGMDAAGVRTLIAVSSGLDPLVEGSGLDYAIVSSADAALDTLEP